MTGFKIYASKAEDTNQGWVWLSRPDLPHRSVVKLSTAGCKKGIYCEILTIDDNFVNSYNGRAHTKTLIEPALVASEWYRKRLRVEKGEETEIEVTIANGVLGRLHACLDHPQIVVHFAAILGAVGCILGFLGLLVSIAGLIVSIISLK